MYVEIHITRCFQNTFRCYTFNDTFHPLVPWLIIAQLTFISNIDQSGQDLKPFSVGIFILN